MVTHQTSRTQHDPRMSYEGLRLELPLRSVPSPFTHPSPVRSHRSVTAVNSSQACAPVTRSSAESGQGHLRALRIVCAVRTAVLRCVCTVLYSGLSARETHEFCVRICLSPGRQRQHRVCGFVGRRLGQRLSDRALREFSTNQDQRDHLCDPTLHMLLSGARRSIIHGAIPRCTDREGPSTIYE